MPRWLSSGAAIAWRLLAIVAAVAVSVYALAYLRVVVVPLIVALLISTALRPPTRWLTRHRFSDAAAAGTVMVALLAVLVTALTMAGAAVGRQFSDLADSIQQGIREAGDVLADPPFNLSEADIDQRIDDAMAPAQRFERLVVGRRSAWSRRRGRAADGPDHHPAAAVLLPQGRAGLWRWVVETFGGRSRERLDEVARRSYTALAGYVRGLAIVGAADAAMIGAGLAIVGVPLVVPLMLLTFLGAFVPLIGAFSAGLAAVLIAFVSGGVVDALIVLALVVAVQQIEGHVLYPLIMGRTVNVHPIAVILALAAGGILAGIIGIFIAVPILTVGATVLSYSREAREPPGPEPPPAPAPAAG